MGIFDKLWPKKNEPEAQPRPNSEVVGEGRAFASLTSADLYDFMRGGSETASGEYITTSKALGNMAMLRCVSLISESIGMLPLNLIVKGDAKDYAVDHPLYRVLKVKPNEFQSAYKFKSTMQMALLLHGNAYARVVRTLDRIVRLVPMDSTRVTPKLQPDWTMRYEYRSPEGNTQELMARDVLHLSDLSEDGITGISRVSKAKEAIGLALQAEKAAARLFKNGVMAGGSLTFPNKLNAEQIKNLQSSMEAKYAGAENAQKWMVLEEGGKAEKWAATGAESQHLENRNHQIEEIARAFGVPRPLLMMDDTSWGSGIEQLNIFFVQYGLQHWFTVWEQAIENLLLTDVERTQYYVKFNERALLRGTLKDQSELFAKALGSGGHMPWMTANEVRDLQDLAKSQDPMADKLESPMMRTQNVTSKTTQN
ncbi:MAG: phage portal protein [Comamonadaceae bacterium CG2_30_59_20]|nr:MAG: phage portal protein [Comamonadaceae bacterium CG2_30_59_20]